MRCCSAEVGEKNENKTTNGDESDRRVLIQTATESLRGNTNKRMKVVQLPTPEGNAETNTHTILMNLESGGQIKDEMGSDGDSSQFK